MLGYKVPAPDEAMLVSGGRTKDNAPFRVVTGHGAFILPVFRKARFLTLAMCEAEVAEKCVTQQGITLNVRAVIAFKVGNDTESIISAAQRFLSEQDQMSVLTGRIFAGHLRSIIGSMTVEQIIRERQKLATEVLDGSKEEMARIGLTVDALQIQSIDDDGLGYIEAMSAPHNAAIQQQAQIGRRRQTRRPPKPSRSRSASRPSSPVRPPSSRRSTRPRSTRLRRKPPRPGRSPKRRPSARCCRCAPSWPSAPPSCASRNSSPRWSSRPRPRPSASGSWPIADAEKMKIQAEAAASHDRVALDKALIDQLPEIVEKAARGLANANVTVLNGAEGLTEVASGLVAQGRAIFDALRGTVDYYDDEDGAPPIAINSESGTTSR